MSAAEWPRPAEPVPPRARRGSKKRGAGRPARPVEMEPPLAAPAPPADFLSVEPIALDGEKWPVHPVLWWQPELPLHLPASGLRTERRFKIPVAGFRTAGPTPERPAARGTASPEALALVWNDTLPASDLAPLGWDPRTCLPQQAQNGQSGPEGSDV